MFTGLLYQAPPVASSLRSWPANWGRARLKDVAEINRLSLPEDTDPDFTFRYIDIGSVDRLGRVLCTEEMVFAESPSRARRIVAEGDSIVSTVRTYLRAIAQVPTPADDLIVSTGFATITAKDGMQPRFLYWWLRSKAFVDEVVARSVGVSYPAVNASDIADIAAPVPPPSEQDKIAAYLDAKAARIDELIAENEATIGLLWERRRASVFDAVTGRSLPGLRREGVPWAGSIPKSWEFAKLTTVATLGSGHTPARNRPELWEDCSIPWITTGEVAQIRSDEVEVLTETREMISERGVAESSAVLHPRGTVVLSRTASAGFSAIMGKDMATSQDFAAWACGTRLLPEFLLHCLRAMRTDLLERLAMGSTHQTIYMPEIKSIVVPLPSLDEQRRIVEALKPVLRRLDILRSELEAQVTLLREHRQALITAAVIGGLEALGRTV